MEPTTYELIFWAVLGVIALVFLLGALFVKSDSIEITDRKLKEWEREEKRWR